MSDNKQYWVNQNGVQAGPVTKEKLAEMAINSEAYVWCAGMDDWVPITQIEELKDIISEASQPEAPAAEASTEDAPADKVADKATDDDATADQKPVDDIPVAEGIPIIPPAPPAAQPVIQGVPLESAAAVVAPAASDPETPPKCPPTNLVWAIIATLLCCLPLGAISIYYSVKVSMAYNAGDYKKAERMSEVSAWWCIGAIVGGIIAQPFTTLIQMALMG